MQEIPHDDDDDDDDATFMPPLSRKPQSQPQPQPQPPPTKVHVLSRSRVGRHVIEPDVDASDVSTARRHAIASSAFRYVDPIEAGGGYREIPMTEREKYEVVRRVEDIAKNAGARASGDDSTRAADGDYDPEKVEAHRLTIDVRASRDISFLKVGDAAAAAATTTTTTTTGFPVKVFSDPLHELSPKIWEAAQHLTQIREAYYALLPEVHVLMQRRRLRTLVDVETQIARANLTTRKIERIVLFDRPNVLHLVTTFHPRLDNAMADAVDDESENLLGTAIAGDDTIALIDLPPLLEDRLCVHILLQPARERAPLWRVDEKAAVATPTTTTTCMNEFEKLDDSQLAAARDRFLYKFVCFFFRLH